MLNVSKDFGFLQNLFYLCIFLSSRVAGKCIWECTCTSHQQSTEVNCEGRNYTYFPFVSSLPKNTFRINLKNNNIAQLPSQPDGTPNKKVWTIDLSYNIIEHLMEDRLGKTFTNLNSLYLSHKRIKSLSKTSFSYLHRLEILDLSHNKLTVIVPEWFLHLKLLFDLKLNNNDIHFIKEIGTGWPEIRLNLDLSTNKLRKIPILPRHPSVVNLKNNSAYCGCSLEVNLDNKINSDITVDCVQLNYSSHDIIGSSTEETKITWEKYLKSPKCDPAEILDFSYYKTGGKLALTCVISNSFPVPVVSVYHGSTLMKSSQSSLKLIVKETGLYDCTVTNYIGSDSHQIHINIQNSGITIVHNLIIRMMTFTILIYLDGCYFSKNYHFCPKWYSRCSCSYDTSVLFL